MKDQLLIIGVLLTFLFSSTHLNAQEKQAESEIEIIYFHFTQRCSTCLAIEQEVKKDIEMEVEMNHKLYTFQSINIDNPDTKEIINAFQVEGQTLLIIKGDRIINLTDEAFQYADYYPDKLAKCLIKTLDSI
ncbi:nitrophenyl compound nitroreductase subunit ArsF family protein [Halosquirtibacter xylanolyticus]|uniref:nitrophenyl compound nitroreductase subunit ArsF family protein n=1 Tax=Halosquirtibacter xylanolyticus TaxID=3374599 RepID=UPI0037497909|nr:nitrophenyl compound nitroreductase subunit ArsF family protein [Prolixibacteraceae bacterium]